MALLTPIDLASARKIGARFGIDVHTMVGIARGSVNTNIQLVASDGHTFFMRIFEEQTRQTAAGEAALLDGLADEGVATPRPIRRLDGLGALDQHDGKPVILFPFVQGDMLCQAAIRTTHLEQVGRALAQLHLAAERLGARVTNACAPFRFGREQLLARLRRIPTTAPQVIRAAADDLCRSLEACRFVMPAQTLIHGDLFRDNVIWHDGKLAALIDFESAATGLPTFDLMVTFLAWCYSDRLELDLGRALSDGYTAVRPISAEELETLFDAALFACDRFAATRITDFELRPAGTVVHKDFRRFLNRKRCVLELGRSSLQHVFAPKSTTCEQA